tara:strand:+ start:7371 stop:7853 length:483 start_codon:yes stop_codon:yes gene_type:complete
MAGSIEFSGTLTGKDLRVSVIASRFNTDITSRLVAGVEMALTDLGVSESNRVIYWVPGSFELPLAAKTVALQGKWDALVCVGAVIKGETAHFDYISAEVSRGLADVMQETGIPLGFGVLTTYTIEQAQERSKDDASNKGYEATASAIEMACLLKQLKENT